MSFSRGELLLLGVILAVLGYALVVPIVGIVKAVRRKDRRRPSTGAVVWSSINLGIFGLGIVATVVFGGLPVAPGIGLGLNGIWLYLAIQANRAAAHGGSVA